MASLYGLFATFLTGVVCDAVVYALQPALNAAVANAGAMLGIVPVLLYAVPSWVPFALELVAFLSGKGD
jgi:hypothetical protein